MAQLLPPPVRVEQKEKNAGWEGGGGLERKESKQEEEGPGSSGPYESPIRGDPWESWHTRFSGLRRSSGITVIRSWLAVNNSALSSFSIGSFLWLACSFALSVIARARERDPPALLARTVPYRADGWESSRFTPLNPISVYRFALPERIFAVTRPAIVALSLVFRG